MKAFVNEQVVIDLPPLWLLITAIVLGLVVFAYLVGWWRF